MLSLSKQYWFLLAVFFIGCLALEFLAGVASLKMVGFLVLLMIPLFFVLKWSDSMNKKSYHLKSLNYAFLCKNNENDEVYAWVSEPSKMFKQGRIHLAVFGQDGYVTRTAIINKDELEWAKMALSKQEKSED